MPWAPTPNIPSQMLSFELCTSNNLDGSFPLWPGGWDAHDFQNQFGMRTHQTTAHSCCSQSGIPQRILAFEQLN